MPLDIRQYQPEDREAVLALHRTAFQHLLGNYYKYDLEVLVYELMKNFCVVAVDNDIIIGAGTYTSVKEAFPYSDCSLKEWLQQLVDLASKPSKIDEAVQFFKYQLPPDSCPIAITHFTNEYTRKNIIVNDNDFYFSSVTITPAYRRQGLGTALAKRRIEIAQQQGATAIYASCYEQNYSHVMLSKIGFLPLLRGSSIVKKESAIVEMRLELRQ